MWGEHWLRLVWSIILHIITRSITPDFFRAVEADIRRNLEQYIADKFCLREQVS